MPVDPEQRERLKQLLCREAVTYGETQLSKAGTSAYYIDCRVVTTHPEGAFLVAEIVLDMIEGEAVAAVGGPTLGADPIVGAVCYASHRRQRPVDGFIVRKATKEHGKQNLIEGRLPKDGPVAVVEDVVTSGGSVLEAIDKIEAQGARVARIIAIVDRLQGARQAFEARGYRFTPIFTRDDLGVQAP